MVEYSPGNVFVTAWGSQRSLISIEAGRIVRKNFRNRNRDRQHSGLSGGRIDNGVKLLQMVESLAVLILYLKINFYIVKINYLKCGEY